MFLDTLSTPSPAIASKTFISLFTAFTLAEVLIVLGIIGLIADMTIPTLISRTQEKVAVTKLKKAYATLDSAYRLAISEEGTIETWFTNCDITTCGTIFYKNIIKYLNVSKDCGANEGCFQKGAVKTLDGRNYIEYDKRTTEPKIILADGTSVMFYANIFDNPNCDASMPCGNIKVDIDGLKGKYQFGEDVFIFEVTRQGLMPQGNSKSFETFENYCNKSKSTSGNGQSCAAWVIYNENLDYLKCNDLNWDTKKSCK